MSRHNQLFGVTLERRVAAPPLARLGWMCGRNLFARASSQSNATGHSAISLFYLTMSPDKIGSEFAHDEIKIS